MMLRLVGGGRVLFGTLLLAAPQAFLEPLLHHRVSVGERQVARLLGLRNIVEGAVVVRRRHQHRWLLAGASIDATHALSMIALAAVRPAHRRLASASALVATATATATIVAAKRAPRHDEPADRTARPRTRSEFFRCVSR